MLVRIGVDAGVGREVRVPVGVGVLLGVAVRGCAGGVNVGDLYCNHIVTITAGFSVL